jgi:tetratricopeptide (TPR) repeat protein
MNFIKIFMTIRTLIFLIFFTCLANSLKSQNFADSGYYYQKIGFTEKAAGFFEQYLYSNPYNFQVRLDLGYLFFESKQYSKAREQFDFVAKNSTNENELQMARQMVQNIDSQNSTSVNYNQNVYNSGVSYADSGYYYYNNGNKTKAAEFFELHLKQQPKDAKIRMQLAYIYYDQKKFSNALKHFEYASKYSYDPVMQEQSKSAVLVLKEQLANNSAKSFDIYFYNVYDSFQENYIANLISHLNFKIGPNFFVGPYLDVYTDSRSSKKLIYNDRFIEIGFFLRYYILKNLFFEGRIGYTRQIDLDSNKINLKPMIVYFNRFGDAKSYVSSKSTSKISLYLDIYYAAMYDYKYKNAFLQGSMQQVLRFHTGGYSYVENYLFQLGQFDGRKLDYNNYFEVGTGLRFKPNLMVFPLLFVEPSYKVYFFGERKNSFQIKAGFIFNYKTAF